jgi:hypothetical protein
MPSSLRQPIRLDLAKEAKRCGNCARVSFGLNGEETELLKEMVLRYGIQCVLRWFKRGSVGTPGGYGLDYEKNKAVELIRRHQTHCNPADTKVLWIEPCCYAWRQASESQNLKTTIPS